MNKSTLRVSHFRSLMVAALAALLVSAAGAMGPAPAAATSVLPGWKMDLEFAKIGEVSLTLDAFSPEGAGPFPACILVHGGAFTKGDKQSYITPLFGPLSRAGFACFTINYRLAPQHPWPACVEDVQTAIRWVKAHAGEFKVDPARIAIIGESAGGYLVSYVGTKASGETSVAAVVALYAPHDLEFQVRQRDKPGSMTALLGITELNDEAWTKLREASANTYVHPKMPPYFLIQGAADTTVLPAQAERFQKLMQAAGNTCDLLLIPDAGHGMGKFESKLPGWTKGLVEWLNTKLGVLRVP